MTFKHGRRPTKRPIEDEVEDDQSLLQQRLAAIGERFLQSFDDGSDSEDDGKQIKKLKLELSSGAGTRPSGIEGEHFDDWLHSLNKSTPAEKEKNHSPPKPTKLFTKPGVEIKVVDATKYGTLSSSAHRASAKEMNKFMSPESSKIHGNTEKTVIPGRRRVKQKETFREQLAKEVEELGATLLTGKEKKEHEARKIVRLGGRAPKNLKTPLKILQGMRTKETERARKKRDEAIQTGMHIKKKKLKPDAGMKKSSKGLDLMKHAGKFKGGILQINSSLMKSKPRR